MSSQTTPYRGTDSRASSNALSTQNAALRGAALAFAKPSVKPKPTGYKGNNAAFVAATKVGGSSTPTPRSLSVSLTGSNSRDDRLMPQHSGASSSYGSYGVSSELLLVRQNLNRIAIADASDHLQPLGRGLDRSVSPSHIAATLAASRSAPASPNHTGQQQSSSSAIRPQASNSRRSSVRSVSRSREIPDDALDTTSIPPTTSLIGMFERSAETPVSTKKPQTTVTVTKSPAREVQAPKPLRPQSVILKPDPVKLQKPSLPDPRKGNNEGLSKPKPKQRKSSNGKMDKGDASSEDSFVSASDHRPRSPVARVRRPPLTTAESQTIHSLANAIVASSLASSRAASPSKASSSVPPPPPPTRRSNAGLFHHHHVADVRTPSPGKGLRQTMRKPPKDDEEEDINMQRRGRKNIMKKHPNKHHEGDRKRWRDTITERERKRYEAVWASNKGLHVTSNTTFFPPPPEATAGANVNPNDTANFVSNIVVRDIWSRSRLGPDVLSEVWELVDRTGTGRLSREEFVTGLWLIDQRLKGRKLPIRVGDSVWASIGSLGGVKVKNNGRRGR